MRLFRICAAFLFFQLNGTLYGSAPLCRVSSGTTFTNVTTHLQLYDPVKARFVPATQVLPRLPVNKSQLFLIRMVGPENEENSMVLDFGHAFLYADNVQLITAQGIHRFEADSLMNHIPISLARGHETAIMFRLRELNRSSPEKISITLYERGAYENKRNNEQTHQSFFLGLYAFLSLFNAILFFVTGWRIYIKYSLYIFSALLYFSYYYGFLQDLVPDARSFSPNLAYSWYSVIFILYFVFLSEFGDYKMHAPRAWRLLRVGIIFKSAETVIMTIGHLLSMSVVYTPRYHSVVVGLEIVLMCFIIFYILQNKNVRGKIVIIASLFLIAGGIIEQSSLFAGVDNTIFIQLGITCELLIFSVGLGYINKLYYDAKLRAEQQLVQQLVHNEALQRQVTTELENVVRRRTEDLENEKRLVELKNAENELLLSEVHHRVKNNLQVVSSLLSLHENNVKETPARIALKEGRERIMSMELVHKMLYRKSNFRRVEMKEYLHDLCNALLTGYSDRRIPAEIILNLEAIWLDIDPAISLGLIMNELVSNSLKHALPAESQLRIVIFMEKTTDDRIRIEFGDNGQPGSMGLSGGESFGLRIIRGLVRQLQGSLEIAGDGQINYIIVFKTAKQPYGA